MDPFDSTATDARLGTRIADRYRLDERLAAGGMGVVYKGTDLERDQKVAVKFLHDALAGVPDLVKRFRREAEVMRRLQHPNLVGIVDSGLSGNVPYLVMELQDGHPLSELLERGALVPSRAISLIRQVLAGVAHAHQNGVLHRDLKPDNILLVEGEEGEQVKILDFGLAKLLNDEGATQLTNTGFALGTPAYMAPEQARGTATDQRTDLYAIGVVLFQMVVGKKPFVAESPMAVLRMQMDDPPPAPRKVASQRLSGALESVILRTLAKEPRERFASAPELDRALGATPEGQRSRRGRTRIGVGPAKPKTGRAIGALLVLGLAGAGGLYGWSRRARLEKRVRHTVAGVQRNLEGPVKQKLTSAVNATRDALHSLAPDSSGSDQPGASTDDDDDATTDPSAATGTPGEKLESAARTPVVERKVKPKEPPTLEGAARLLSAGKTDDAIQLLYQVRQRAPRSAGVALYLGHAYFRKLWRTDGLREYDTALKLHPAFKRDRLLVRNVVAALDDPTSRSARAVIRTRLGTAALGELRRAARSARSAKVQKRAAHLAARLSPPKRRHRR